MSQIKNQYVVFTETNARIVTNPENPLIYEGKKNIVRDPDLREVEGLPPHFWKLENGKVKAMTGLEQLERQILIDKTILQFPQTDDLIVQNTHMRYVVDEMERKHKAALAKIQEQQREVNEAMQTTYRLSEENAEKHHQEKLAELKAEFEDHSKKHYAVMVLFYQRLLVATGSGLFMTGIGLGYLLFHHSH